MVQNQAKAEEALARFRGGGVYMWAPESNDHIPKIVGAVQKLHEKGIEVQVSLLIPFSPLPLCDSTDLILDLWSHPILQPKYYNIVSGISFLREATRCVITRDNNPLYATKNIVIVSLKAGMSGITPSLHTLRGDLVAETLVGDYIYVDFPTEHSAQIRQALCLASATFPILPRDWRQGFRSRGGTRESPRETILGYTESISAIETNAIVKRLLACLDLVPNVPHQDILVGRQCLFKDPNGVLIEGTTKQVSNLKNCYRECILISPHKAVCIPKVSADDICNTLTANESMHTALLRYRRSGPMRGAIFAKAKAIREHVLAKKQLSYAARAPATEASLLHSQAQLEVLQYESISYSGLPQKIVDKIINLTGTQYTKTDDQYKDLEPGEWREVQRGGIWCGRILMQCTTIEERDNVYGAADGRGICVEGVVRSIAVSTPTIGNLGACLFPPPVSTSP